MTAYRTVNLKHATFERLRTYQVGGATLNDVIEGFMDSIDPTSVYAKALKVHRQRMRSIKKHGGLTLKQLRERLGRP